ncbi:hypothetical protein ACH6CV_16360 [Bacillota bacterium Meth-B3]
MPMYTKGHERDENRAMNKAFSRSLLGLVLSPIPLVGLALAIGGFIRMMVRFTQTHRLKRVVLTIFATLVLLISIFVLGWEVHTYAQNPNFVADSVREVWKSAFGAAPPWEATPTPPPETFDDYKDYGVDPFATDPDADTNSGAPGDFDSDSDFDDGELVPFPEDEAADAPGKDLFNQMLAEEKMGGDKLPLPKAAP